MIIDIRGTNGSGKSHVVHGLIDRFGSDVEIPLVPGYAAVTQIRNTDIVAIGRYHTQCGGADGVTSQQCIQETIRCFVKTHHVIVEGSIVATVFSRWKRLADRLGDYHFLFLDTPLEVSIKRVLQRRLDKGNDKHFDPNKTLIPRHRAIMRVRQKLAAAGCNVFDLDHTDSVQGVLDHVDEHNAA